MWNNELNFALIYFFHLACRGQDLLESLATCKLFLHALAYTHKHTHTPLPPLICITPSFSVIWNSQGISRPVRARVKPGVPGARADCPPSQPLARLCTSRVLSSIWTAYTDPLRAPVSPLSHFFFKQSVLKRCALDLYHLNRLISIPPVGSDCAYLQFYSQLKWNEARQTKLFPETTLLLFKSRGACQRVEAVFPCGLPDAHSSRRHVFN